MNETLYAQFDFPVLKSEAQIQQEKNKALEAVVPYYRLDQSVFSNVEKSLNQMQMGELSYLKGELAVQLDRIYDRGVISLDSDRDSDSDTDADLVYVQRDRRAERMPISELYTSETALEQIKYYVKSVVNTTATRTITEYVGDFCIFGGHHKLCEVDAERVGALCIVVYLRVYPLGINLLRGELV